MSAQRGHGHVRAAIRDYLAHWVPLRLILIREESGSQFPADPRSYSLADALPDNDPNQYPAVVVTSTRTTDRSRRRARDQESTVIDVTYEVTVVVATARNEYGDDERVSADRSDLLLAVSDCFALPTTIDDLTEVLSTPIPQESTGAAQQTVRGNPIAAGTITVQVRVAEPLMPNAALAQILGADLTVIPYDASAESLEST